MPPPPKPAPDRTVLMPRRDIDAELRAGTALQEFVVEGTVGAGGFSIVYRARDTRLDRLVAVKEYLPAAFALRGADGIVHARSPRHQQAFDLGLQSYLKEARLLASFDHPALVRVFRFWGERGTAYMVMPLYEGMTLKRWLVDLGATPSEAWLREFALQMTQALAALHGQRIFHRDVAPDNILLQYDRHAGPSFLEQKPRPMLLDFGAARRVIGDATQALTAILKSGYSPPEQYEGAESKRQGAWTDVYALAAVMYTAIAGRAPPSAIARLVKDQMVPAAQVGAGRYSPGFLAAIDAGLAPRPEQRPQTMVEFLAALDSPVPLAAGATAPARAAPAAPKAGPPKAGPDAPRPGTGIPRRTQLIVAAVVGAVVLALAAAALWTGLRG
jgi:serine/threonine protein kinase